MPQSLTQLKKNSHGYPAGLSKKSWDNRLDLMINAFKIARKIQNYNYKTKEELEMAMKQFRRDFNVFKMHYFSLWD